MVEIQLPLIFRRYEEDMYWRRVEEEQHHWDERRRGPDGGYPQGPPGPPGLLGVRPGIPGLQPQGPLVRSSAFPLGISKPAGHHLVQYVTI